MVQLVAMELQLLSQAHPLLMLAVVAVLTLQVVELVVLVELAVVEQVTELVEMQLQEQSTQAVVVVLLESAPHRRREMAEAASSFSNTLEAIPSQAEQV